jgi:hypothetical protein
MTGRMASGAAWWVRTDDVDAIRAAIGSWRDAELDGDYVRIENDAEPPRELMQRLSRSTEAFWFATASSTDSLHYVHYTRGKLVREIVHGFAKEHTWEKAVGRRESWEPWKIVLGGFAAISSDEAAHAVFAQFGLGDAAANLDTIERSLWLRATQVAVRKAVGRKVSSMQACGAYVRAELRHHGDELDPPPELVAGLSRSLATDVVWIGARRRFDELSIVHHRNGKLVRDLAYGLEQQFFWTRIAGTAQPWEAWDTSPALDEIDPLDAGEAVDRLVAYLSRTPRKG